ncbi:unnamed protein product [Rotaria magnacalcarata]|uniref:Uncharacterized protein n=1 Tax=Rotaria magnacalcarata TaxID=392030 RepID=A0A816DFH5_9BILA|nr:unnamed protein product [Rotaria magnacalcarata]CAF4371604.1 unnamed protein product [Rotaria magnacalcarata]
MSFPINLDDYLLLIRICYSSDSLAPQIQRQQRIRQPRRILQQQRTLQPPQIQRQQRTLQQPRIQQHQRMQRPRQIQQQELIRQQRILQPPQIQRQQQYNALRWLSCLLVTFPSIGMLVLRIRY